MIRDGAAGSAEGPADSSNAKELSNAGLNRLNPVLLGDSPEPNRFSGQMLSIPAVWSSEPWSNDSFLAWGITEQGKTPPLGSWAAEVTSNSRLSFGHLNLKALGSRTCTEVRLR